MMFLCFGASAFSRKCSSIGGCRLMNSAQLKWCFHSFKGGGTTEEISCKRSGVGVFERSIWARNSLFPFGPIKGDWISPSISKPFSWANSSVSLSTLKCSSGERTTPFPFATSLRPASNCGLISATTSRCEPSFATNQFFTAGKRIFNEMKDASITRNQDEVLHNYYLVMRQCTSCHMRLRK